MTTVALVARREKPEAVALATRIKEQLPAVHFVAEPHLATALGWPVVPEAALGGADLLVVLGGDGTMIRASRLLGGRPVPVLGVNLGSLGFLTEVTVDRALGALDDALAGKVETESRMKLQCRLYREGQLLVEDEVLNDVVISKSALARINDHETYLAGDYVATFKADGVIFSTPTGSTAYNLSAGGPIVHPAVDCVVVTPICPHALTQRPIVVPADEILTVRLGSEADDVYLTLDGQAGHALRFGDRVEVQRSPHRLVLVTPSFHDYFGMLRQKLRWGER